ncbi:MAG: hypothetical protein LBG82_05965 [Clostridiales Family XIII bacterium]|jgi:hypothetical protein|nr:hypothetical protein [Clostridiales Family XIII bacterium]
MEKAKNCRRIVMASAMHEKKQKLHVNCHGAGALRENAPEPMKIIIE